MGIPEGSFYPWLYFIVPFLEKKQVPTTTTMKNNVSLHLGIPVEGPRREFRVAVRSQHGHRIWHSLELVTWMAPCAGPRAPTACKA